MKYNIILPKISLNELIINHKKLSIDYSLKFRQLSFKEYLKNGNYPFGLNNTS
jgi:hypothetical protein